jgi:hypothetical protein
MMFTKHQIMSKSLKWHATLIIISISIDASLHLYGQTKLLNCQKKKNKKQKKKNDSPVSAIMNVMFGYCRMLWSEATYWGSSTWVRTKGARVAWWSTSPRFWAWQPLHPFLFMLPRSTRSSVLLDPSE